MEQNSNLPSYLFIVFVFLNLLKKEIRRVYSKRVALVEKKRKRKYRLSVSFVFKYRTFKIPEPRSTFQRFATFGRRRVERAERKKELARGKKSRDEETGMCNWNTVGKPSLKLVLILRLSGSGARGWIFSPWIERRPGRMKSYSATGCTPAEGKEFLRSALFSNMASSVSFSIGSSLSLFPLLFTGFTDASKPVPPFFLLSILKSTRLLRCIHNRLVTPYSLQQQ